MRQFYNPHDQLKDGSDISDIEENNEIIFETIENIVPMAAADLDYPTSDSNDDDEDNIFSFDTDMEDSSSDDEYKRNRTRFGNSTASGDQHLNDNGDMDDDEEDEVIKKIIAETRKERTHPPDIITDDFVFDLCFHPLENILAVGTIAGDVILYQYSNDENKILSTLEVHTKSINDLDFSADGNLLISVSKDRSIMLSDVRTEKLIQFYDAAHENPIYSVKMISENLLATGDDDGMLKVWDLRQNERKPLFQLKLVEDYISQILTNDASKLLLTTSGDGYLTAVSIGSRKLYVQSEPYEEELNCMGLFRNDSKLVVGSSKGRLYSYNWGEFGIHSDMYQGPKTGINCMSPVTSRIGVFGGEEGVLSALHVIPGRHLGVVGQHALSVEAIDICNTGEFIASSSHDNDIRFWNIKYFEDFDDIKYNDKENVRKQRKHNLPSSKQSNASDFFSDLVGGDT